MKDKVMPNNSQVKDKKNEVEDHPRISSISNKTKSVTASNDSLKSRTLNVNVVCATCGKCVFNVRIIDSWFLNICDRDARTKKPKVVPISTRKPKSQANKSVTTPRKKAVASESTTQKSKSYYRMLYEKTSKAWKWWIEQQCPSGYKWVPMTKIKWVPKVRNENVQKRVSFAIDNASRIINIVQLILFIVDSGCTKHMTDNLTLMCNFVEKYMGTVHFGNDQFPLILGYEDLVQGNITINKVYYVEGLNHNLFSVGQFCDADLEVAFWKSTCFVRYLLGNDLLIDNRGSDLYTISLQETTSSTPLCLMAKALPTQAWLWHRRLSHLNFPEYNLNFFQRRPRVPTTQASDYDNSDPIPQLQNVIRLQQIVKSTITTRLDLLSVHFVHEFFQSAGLHHGAMQEELHQFDRLQVWELVDKPFGKNVIKLKWLWKNKKDEDQTSKDVKEAGCTAMSPPMRHEYVALSASCAQVMWMRTQLKDYGFNYNKIPLYCDSQSAIAIPCSTPIPSTSILDIISSRNMMKTMNSDIEDDIMDPVMQCTSPPAIRFPLNENLSHCHGDPHDFIDFLTPKHPSDTYVLHNEDGILLEPTNQTRLWGHVYEAILRKKITRKEDIGGNFKLPRNIGGLKHMNTLVDQGSDVNVMALSTYMKLTDERPAETDIRLSLPDHWIPESLCKDEKGIKNDIEPIVPTMTVIFDEKKLGSS
ncbi:hypothetical protein Tco_0300477 [Tanacetum coccineum]